MSVFSRIASREISPAKPKIAVWPIIVDFTRMLDNEISIAQLAVLYDMDQSEITECTEYLGAFLSRLSTTTAALIADGINAVTAEELARSRIHSLVWHLLLRIEHGTLTLAEFRNRLGLI
jgi:hypothetical protein